MPGRSLKPGVLVGCMARDKIQHHLYAAPVGFVKQPHDIVLRSVTRRDLAKVTYIVAGIFKRGFKTRVEPYRIAAQ